MAKKDLIALGSQTAKNGFKNENDIVQKFNNWQKDEDTQTWLGIMGYVVVEIEKVIAIKLHGYKTDVQVQITIYLKQAIAAENLSIKLVSNPQGFNQIDKRWIDKYTALWEMPEDITRILKCFTGEIPPIKSGCRDKRRMFLNEMDEADQNKIIDCFNKDKF
ncbi:hypothetical protein NURINAE_01226 [Candidatus Nitrosacidococcus sp. I8]|nr:hypothetical protein [Candidatus Nitrosacidococcus sp. I8]CAH9018929.1 hypothetical protein NURINAE_01226 [Candidatus Nitrosacidococcus sp. I8]